MGSNQQARYTGIQAQVNQQQQGGIGVTNFQPMDLSGIAKTIETIDNHIVKVQDANRTVDYLTLTEQLKAVDQEQSTFSSTIDKDGNLTLLDGTKQNYKDYLASAYEKKVQLVGDFKSKWKANRFQNDEMGVRIRSMQETMPIDRLQSEKAIELNLAQIQLVSTLEDISANPNLDFTQKIITMDNAIESTPMAFEQKQQSKRRYAGVAIEVAFKDHENYLGQLSTELEKQSGGNAELYSSLLKQSLESPEYQKRQEALTQGLNVLAEVSQVDDIAVKSLQGLTAQEIQQRQAIVKQEGEQNQRRLNQYSKIAMQDANYAVQLALSGQGDSKAVSNAMVHLSQLIKNKTLASDDKVQLNEMVKELVEAKKIGNQLASNPMGIDVRKISNPAIAGEALRIQQSYIEEQKRLAEKEVEKQQRENQQSMDLVLDINGLPTEQQRLQAVKLGVNLAEQGILPLTKQEVVDSLLRNPNNLFKSYQETIGRYGLSEDSSGASAWFKTVAEQYGISKDVSIESIRAVSDNMQEAVQYLDYIKKASASNYSFQTMSALEKNLIKDTTTGYNKDQNAYLNSVRGIIPNGVLKQIVWGKTYQEQKTKVFADNGDTITKEFQDAFNKNYKLLSKEMLSNRKKQVQQQGSVGVAYQQGAMLKVDPASFGSVNIKTGKETNLNRQPLGVIAGLNVLNMSQKKYGLKGLQVTSMYRAIPTSEGTKHSQKKNVVAFDFVTDNQFNLRQQDLKLYATIEGLQKLGRVAITGKNDYMYQQLYQMQALKEYNLAGLTKSQNANLRKWVKAMPLIKSEGENADTHLHITVGGITPEKVKQYTPSYYAQKLQVGR